MDLFFSRSQTTRADRLVQGVSQDPQLPTYFLGTRQWWTLRKKYQAAKGGSFTLEEFHDRALDQGPLPIEYLEKIILPQLDNRTRPCNFAELLPRIQGKAP